MVKKPNKNQLSLQYWVPSLARQDYNFKIWQKTQQVTCRQIHQIHQ